MAVIIAYVSAMFIALSKPIIQVVFERGEFTPDDTALTANALLFYSVGMVGYAICEILNKSFYAVQDGKTPMLTSITGVIVNFASAFVFVRLFEMGVGGLALASAVSSIFMAVVLIGMMNKKKSGTFGGGFVVNILKVLVCGAVSAVVARSIYMAVDGLGQGMAWAFLKLVLSAVPGLLAYLIVFVILKTDEIKQIRSLTHEK